MKEWLERQIEKCLDDKDLQRELWAFRQCLKEYNRQNGERVDNGSVDEFEVGD